MQGAARSINLLRLECEPALPLGYLIQLVWPLTAQATCLWRSSERSTVVPAPAISINLLQTECEPLLPPDWVILKVWLLTGQATCLWLLEATVSKFTPTGVRHRVCFRLNEPICSGL